MNFKKGDLINSTHFFSQGRNDKGKTINGAMIYRKGRFVRHEGKGLAWVKFSGHMHSSKVSLLSLSHVD